MYIVIISKWKLYVYHQVYFGKYIRPQITCYIEYFVTFNVLIMWTNFSPNNFISSWTHMYWCTCSAMICLASSFPLSPAKLMIDEERWMWWWLIHSMAGREYMHRYSMFLPGSDKPLQCCTGQKMGSGENGSWFLFYLALLICRLTGIIFTWPSIISGK